MLDADKLFDDISKFIADSRAIIAQGDVVKLDDLDGEVKRLCEAVFELSEEERVKYASRMQELLKDLNALGEELTEQRDQVATQLHNMADHRRAHVAYKTADATEDKKGDNTDDGNG